MKRLSRSLLALVLLLLLAALLWRSSPRQTSEPVQASPDTPGPASPMPSGTHAATPTAESGMRADGAAPADESAVLVIEGFLIATELGLAVGEAIVPESQGWGGIDFDQRVDAAKALLGRLIEPPALEKLPRSAALDFNTFLNGDSGPSSVPQAHLRLRVRPVRPSGDFKLPRLRVMEIIEEEILGDAWLCAWREMFGLESDLLMIRRKLDPGLEKRNRVLELATKFTLALSRARAARAGERVVRWRVRREAAACVQIAHVLEKFGLRSAIPEAPDPWSLWDLAKVAATPAEFRKTLLELGGPEQLLLELRYQTPTIAEQDGEIIGWQDRRVDVESVCGMTAEDFAALQKELRAWDDAEEQRPSPDVPEYERLGEIGLVAEPASRGDCERLILEGGARIVSVETGSVADAAGLRTGDIIWRVRRVAADGSEIPDLPRHFVEHPRFLETYLTARGEPNVAIEFFRDGRAGTTSLRLGP